MGLRPHAYGHDVGDVVLRAVATAIGNTVAEAGARRVTIARIGGEEFAALVEGLVPTAVGRLAERIRRNVRGVAVRRGDEILRATVSVGVALGKGDKGINGALRAADEAVYAAKHAGRDRWAFAGAEPAGDGRPSAARGS